MVNICITEAWRGIIIADVKYEITFKVINATNESKMFWRVHTGYSSRQTAKNLDEAKDFLETVGKIVETLGGILCSRSQCSVVVRETRYGRKAQVSVF